MQIFKRLFVYALGLFILSIGVVFSARCNLGASPIGAVPLALSQTTGITLGACSMYSMLFCIALQIIMLRKKYKWINITQIFTSILFGGYVFVAEKLMLMISDLNPSSLVEQSIYLILSIICIGFGVYLYLKGRLVNLPADGVFVVIHQKFGFSIPNSKIIFDMSFALLSMLITLIFLGGITAVGIGTFVSVIFVGKFIGLVHKFLEEPINHFLGVNQVATN
ncbi:MAG: DUF6198 family protein [Succinivibrionaceae bacterium]|nr:DUF6198 family protein [Ruminobacter sp.]MDY5778895.1 DUF6198 family protein [Succinivibrionaceae bacterium]MEE1339336.1 DUF6198 family protein [Succinivibrionaceae bacterium]